MAQATAPRAYQRVVDQIRGDIFAGRRRPGERLPTEPALGAQFGLSRAGVREALRVLELQGLVEVRHGHGGGAFVAQPSCLPVLGALEDSLRFGLVGVDELYQARRLVEPAMVRLAIERDALALAALLTDNVERTRRALTDGASISALNREFHARVAEVAGNQVLALTMRVLQGLLERLDERQPNARTLSRCALQEHRRLLDAVRAADADEAERLMREHLLQLEGRLRRGGRAGRQAGGSRGLARIGQPERAGRPRTRAAPESAAAIDG